MKIEGRNPVRETILAGTQIAKIYASNNCKDKVFNDIISLAKEHKIKIQFVANDILNRESATGHHQGLVAVTEDFKYCQLDDILEYARSKGEPPFILILDGVEDPHNLGSIIRVCDCLGVHGVVIGKNRACGVNETVIKTSAGATNYVNVAKVTNINDAIKKLKSLNVWVYACELGGQDIARTDLTGAVAIVMGSEGSGVSALTKKLCDGVFTIDMVGKVNSLNVSVATGIALYESYTQRKGKK